MKRLFNLVMRRRAKALTGRLRPWLPPRACIADIGSGTGHNAEEWRTRFSADVDEFDVADLHWTGPGPALFDGQKLPADDSAYDVVTLLFVLQYSSQVLELLTEVRRIARGPVLIVQSTCGGAWGRFCLRWREWCWGPLAFHVARCAGLVRGQPCSLMTRRSFSTDELRDLFHQAGLQVAHWEPQRSWSLRVSRDLFVLVPRTRL